MSDTKIQCRNSQMRLLKFLIKECYEKLYKYQNELLKIDNYFNNEIEEENIEDRVNKLYYYTNRQFHLSEEIEYQFKRIRIISTEITKFTC